MNLVVAAICIVMFWFVLRRLRVLDALSSATALARSTGKTLMDPSVGDEEKELRARQAAAGMLKAFGTFLMQNAAALLLPAILTVATIRTKIITLPGLENAFLSWPIILLALSLTGYEIYARR